MKAQRRHELQQNALATKIVQLPNLGRIWLGRAMMGLAAIALVAAFIVSRVQRSHQKAVEATELLSLAQMDIQTLKNVGPTGRTEPEPLDANFMIRAQTAYEGAKLKLQQMAERSEDHRLLGQAALLRGDMNLALSTIPPIPGATTQPSLAPHPDREEAAKLATDAYKEVLEKFSDQLVNVTPARLGLATLAKNHLDFKSAREQYQAVTNDTTASEMYRQFARREMDSLDTLSATPLIVTSPVPPLTAANPATTQATTQSAMQAATTRPATSQAK